jgi:hypothetical protein
MHQCFEEALASRQFSTPLKRIQQSGEVPFVTIDARDKDNVRVVVRSRDEALGEHHSEFLARDYPPGTIILLLVRRDRALTHTIQFKFNAPLREMSPPRLPLDTDEGRRAYIRQIVEGLTQAVRNALQERKDGEPAPLLRIDPDAEEVAVIARSEILGELKDAPDDMPFVGDIKRLATEQPEDIYIAFLMCDEGQCFELMDLRSARPESDN